MSFMKRNQGKIDGFYRRADKGSIESASASKDDTLPEDFLQSNSREGMHSTGAELDNRIDGLDKVNVDDGLSIKKRRRRNTKKLKRHSLRKRILRSLFFILILITLSAIGYFVFNIANSGFKVFNGNITGFFQQKQLKKDVNGRSNVLLLGSTDDDPTRGGAELTDSIMVVSVDQKTRDVALLSIPRDLYVDFGLACNAGYSGKINEYYSCVKDDKEADSEQKALLKTQEFVGSIVGLDIQYGVHVNSNVIHDVVKALDGITVTIDSRNPDGILDSNFDWICRGGKQWASQQEIIENCPPRGHYIDFPNGEVVLDAKKAMYFSRARGVQAPTYGLEESNFDREKNQQKIIIAIKDKATSSGILADAGKVMSIVNALGDNLRTNFDVSEIRTLIDLAGKIDTQRIKKIPFIDDEKGIELMVNSYIGGSVVVPAAGQGVYGDIQNYINNALTAGDQVAEKIVVLNGTEKVGLAQLAADKITDLSLEVVRIGNANTKSSKTVIYTNESASEAVREKLVALYGDVFVVGIPDDISVSDGVGYVVIVGSD